MTRPASSGRRSGLVALNIALLAALAVVALAPGAGAQNQPAQQNQAAGAQQRPRGQYTMINGRILAGTEDAIYIVDANNMEVLAMRFEIGTQRMVGIGFRDLAADGGRIPARPR